MTVDTLSRVRNDDLRRATSSDGWRADWALRAVHKVVVAHPSPLGRGLGDDVSDFLVFDMVYQVLEAGRAGFKDSFNFLKRRACMLKQGSGMQSNAVTPTIQSIAEREQSRKEHRRHCGPGDAALPASIPWQTGSVSALPEDSVRSCMARAGLAVSMRYDWRHAPCRSNHTPLSSRNAMPDQTT